jgi:hypothetical protein
LLGDAGDFEETSAAEDVASPDEDTLLAAPGKRDDKRKGKKPPANREDGRRKGQSGPRSRSHTHRPEMNTPRINNPGSYGQNGLSSLSSVTDQYRKAGLFQEDVPNRDNLEESMLFEVKHEIKELITELNKSKLGGTDAKK